MQDGKNFSAFAEDAFIKKVYIDSLGTMILAAIAILLSALVDGVAISTFLGADATAAYGLVSPIYLSVLAIGVVTSKGVSVYCSRLLGKGDIEGAIQGYSSNFFFTFMVGLVCFLACFFFGHQIVDILGAGKEPNTYAHALDFIHGLAPAFFIMPFISMFIPIFYLDNGKKYVLYGMATNTAVNIIGDISNALYFHDGMYGMGLSTLAGCALGLLVMLLHFRDEHIFSFTTKDFSLKPMIEIASFGAPKAINKWCNFFRNLALNHIILFVGNMTALAAFALRNTLNNIFAAGTTGIGQATLLLGAIFAGEEDKTSLKKLLAISIKYGLLLTTAISVVMIAIAGFLTERVSAHSEVAQIAAESLRWYMVSVPLFTLVMVFMNYYRAIGKKFLTGLVCFLDNFGFVTLFSVILAPIMGVRGIWIAFPLGEIAMLIMIYIMSWKTCGHIPKELEDFMMLPENFDYSDKERYFGRIRSYEEACSESEAVRVFLLNQNVSQKTAYILSVFVEEICVNTIRWGIDEKKQSAQLAEVYLVHKDGEWRLRIRDNCNAFNPKKWYGLHKDDDTINEMGIKLAFKMADKIDHTLLYGNTLSINNLLIRVPDSL